MRLTRRTFVKGAGGATASLFVTQYGLDWLAPERRGPAGGGEAAETVAYTEEWKPTTCWIGKQDCGMRARVVNGRLVKLEGHPAHPRNLGTLCPKGVAQIQAVYDPHRVKGPLIRTNAKGVSGEWRRATWDEALALAGEQIKAAREKDPKYLVWQKGRSKAEQFYDGAFLEASGATKLHHGGFCSDAGYRAMEYTVGLKGVLHPDFRYTNYLISYGWNLLNGGGNKLCQITWHRQMLEAKARGMKIVHIDPSRRVAGPFADEWLPIRPSTDMAFFLGIANVLADQGYVDREYLTQFTNAPFLVKPDGLFLTVTEGEGDEAKTKALVHDEATDTITPFDAEGVAPSLEGTFTAEDGTPLKAGFQLVKEHLAQYPPEWAAAITGLPADVIRRIAVEIGEAAQIGSTIVVEGKSLPHRPVAIMGYHVTQQELGFQATRAGMLVMMLLGAVDTPGGQRSDWTYKVNPNFEKFGNLAKAVKDGPYNIWLNNSKFFPINSNNSSIVAHVMNDPAKWEVDYLPEVLVIHMSNPVLAYADQPAILASYPKFKFIIALDPWLSETADLFADVILPPATIEKYEGPLDAGDGYIDAQALRVPPMEPLYNSRGDIDIYLDLCEKAGILYGEEGYLAALNHDLKLEDEHALDVNAKPTVREIFDRWAKVSGIEEGVAYFETQGVKVKGPFSVDKLYGRAGDPPYAGIRHRLYGESLKAAQDVMKVKGVDEIFWRLYTPLPTWMPATMEGSPPEYDLYLISRKMIEFKQARSTFIPILNELAPKQVLEINPLTAKARGIKDGGEVVVESHNAVTGETRRVKTRVLYLETMRPDTVCLPHHYGFFVNPITKDQGPTANALFFSGPGYVANTADQSFQVKVKVTKA